MDRASEIVAPASRNAPCPCGSGKRYKDCHGALGGTSQRQGNAAPGRDTVNPVQRMFAALAAQQNGRLDEAVALYQAAIDDDPANFDALHMLGVVRYEQGRNDEAEVLLHRAIAINPFFPAAHENLRIIEAALRRHAAGIQLCRELLPQLAPMCVQESVAHEQGAFDTISDVAVVIACLDEDADIVKQLASVPTDLGSAITWRRWHRSPNPKGLPMTPVAWDGVEPLPRARTLMFAGTAAPAGPWRAALAPERILLMCGAADPCGLFDRVRELSDEGRRPVELVFADSAAASMAKLPGQLVPPDAGVDWWRNHLGCI